MSKVERLEHDGLVAVVISTGYGGGWSTWARPHNREILALDKGIALAVMQKDFGLALNLARRKCPDESLSMDGNLGLVWVDKGLAFLIQEYDGHESITTVSSDWMVA